MYGWLDDILCDRIGGSAFYDSLYSCNKCNKKNEKEIRPSKDTASSERIISIAQVKEAPPPDVAVLYEAPHKNVANLCRFCGCEYASPVVICEICGEKLLRG